MRSATILLILKAEAHLKLGNSPAALGEIEQGFRLHTALSSELSLIAGLTRLSHLGMLENCIWDGLAAGQWHDEELTAIENHFADLRLVNDCRFAFASERGFANAAGLELAKNGFEMLLDQMKSLEKLGLVQKPSFAEKLVLHMIPRGWAYVLMVRRNEYFDWLLAQFDEPNGGAAADFFPLMKTSEDWLESHPVPPGLGMVNAWIDGISLPVFDNAHKQYLYAHTRAQETRLACTLESFRRAKGGFPEKLDELMPGFIDAIPKDVFDSKPLRYRRNADGGYDLWSIGPDRKDDGGKIDPEKGRDDQDDWLWHMPGQPKNR